MKKITVIFTLITISLTATFGQTSTDSIAMEQVYYFWYTFHQGEKSLNWNQIIKTMQPNDQAFKEMKKARSTYALGTTVSIVAPFLILWPLLTDIPNYWGTIGIGLVVVSWLIFHKCKKQAKKAIDTFNGGIKTSSFWDRNELRLGLTGNGIGFSLRF